MAINKNFKVTNGLEVNKNLIFADTNSNKVGIATTIANHTLHVNGGIGATNLSITGVSTFSNLVLNGYISAGGTVGNSAQFLISTGTGVTWSTISKKSSVFTASIGQTSFSFSYEIGTTEVYINGVRLAPSEFTATDGSTVVLNDACFGDETVEIIGNSFIPNVVDGWTETSGGGLYRLSNVGVGTTNPTSKLDVGGTVTATEFLGNLTGTATTASSVAVDSVGLGTHTYGDYIKDISGTANQITVTGGTGEGSSSTLSIPNQFTAPQDVTVLRDLQVNRNLNVNGNITIGGTSATLFTTEFKVYDPDIVLGFRTDGSGNDISTDNTANHGGIAIASTEGSPLINLYDVGIGETNPATYKKFMWFKTGAFSGLGTDAWLSNYAIGIGSTQFPSGTRLAAGSVQFTERDLASVRNINSSGIITTSSLNVTGTTRITGFIESQNTSTNTNNILSLDAAQGTVFTHTTTANIGIVSFTGISTSKANTQTFTVLVTQGAVGYNTTAATGIGTQLATIVTEGGVGYSTHIKVGSGTTITLTSTPGALDLLTFIVSYNGVGVSNTSFTVIGMNAQNFRGVI